MVESVFDFDDYKAYLRAWIESRPQGGHGARSQIARVVSCHLAYVSQVLNAGAHFSSEQAIALADYLHLDEDELDFFLLLLARQRAGSVRLTRYYEKRIRAVRRGREVLSNRLRFQETISEHAQARFYSSWHYIAAHLLITMPEFQSLDALAKRLGLGPERIAEIAKFLCQEGLARNENGRLSAGPTSTHLGADSPMLAKHHTNWRMKAIESLDREKTEELHYSSVATVARDDAPHIRKTLLQAIEKVRQTVRHSRENSLYCYNLDWFEV